MRIITTAILLLCSAVAHISAGGRLDVADAGMPADSLHTTDIEEIVVVSTPKETARLRQQPISATAFAQDEMRQRNIDGMKALTAHVPNLFIPAYGSRLTTSVYIRGIGSRTGTPAVALYVDGVPQISPASFDFNFSDVDRIDVLRGAQATLYGRNSMGGVVRVFTKNPFHYQGTDITLNGAILPSGFPNGRPDGGPGRGRATVTHYHRISDKLAFSANFFGERDGGFFRNAGRDDELIDSQTDLGGRLRLIWRPKATLDIDVTASHEWLRQGGYPYEYQGIVGKPTTPDPAHHVGTVAYDNRSGYRRNLTNAAVTIDKRWRRATLTSVTGFQHLHDRMDLDQDFTDRNLYTLMQRQNVNTISEEIIVRNPATQPADAKVPDNRWAWLFGIAAMRQWNTTDGPVSFNDDGLAWLNGLVNNMANTHMHEVSTTQYTMNFMFNNQVLGRQLGFPGTYKMPVSNAALFHQSTIDNLFGAEGLSLTAGLRIEYEYLSLDYDARYGFDQSYALGGRLTYPDGSVREGMVLVPESHFRVDDAMHGNVHDDYVKLLPKFTLQWSPKGSNATPLQTVYASISRGYRSGGYNCQMFSELLQARMQSRIMKNVTASTMPIVREQPSMPDVAKATVEQILTSMSEDKPIDVTALTWYKPESSWNYEVGAHLNFFDSRLQADAALFYLDTRDRQLSQMAAGGLGRVTVNSGHSRSLGAELSLRARVTDDLDLQAAYGFTDARFTDQEMVNGSTLADKAFVPFVPRHTLSVGATQSWSIPSRRWMEAVLLHADYRAAGRVYWNEANSASQAFAGMLNARLTLRCSQPQPKTDHPVAFDIALYATNILATRYQTFYFETMQRGFAQYTRPTELGIELRLRF